MIRRDLLKQASLAAGAVLVAPRALAAVGAEDLAADLSVTIEQGARRLVFVARNGKDLGDFKTATFTQRCIRADIAGSPLSVFFRPDRDSERVEIVVELGRMWGAANAAAAHWDAYRAVIAKGTRVLATVEAPRHWWFSRWRWQSAPRPITRKIDDLLKEKLLLPYAASVAGDAEPTGWGEEAQYRPEFKNPMDNAGLHVRVGTAGERYDFGPMTEFQAEYVVNGREQSLRALRAQAEASASMPMHMRDEKTNAPVDFFQYPKLDWYESDTGEPWVRSSVAIRDAKGEETCPWGLSTAHDPALNYLPYLLTGDPYHLEELQFQANQLLGWTAYHRAENNLQIVYPDQSRSFAWSMRTMFQLAKVTPEAVPSWLKPRTYWKRIVNDNLTWFTQAYVNKTAPPYTVFHAATRLDSVAPWQEDFIAAMLAWGVMLGFERWRPAFLWKLKSTLARTNGKSGWPRQFCTPYHFPIATSDPPDMLLYAERSPQSIWFNSWAEAWTAYRSQNKITEPFPDATSWAQTEETAHYLIYTRAVLALATHLGVEEAREPFAFVDRMARGQKFMLYKWAIAPA